MRRRGPSSIDAEVADEIHEHLAARIEDLVAKGVPADEARAQVLARFGSVRRIEAASAQIRRRQVGPLRGWTRDVQHAWLALRRRPLTSLAALLVAAFGLTVTLSVWRVADALVSPPPGLRAPGELSSLLESYDGEHGNFFSYAVFTAMQSAVPDAPLAAWDVRDLQVVAGSDARMWTGAVASSSYFTTLGAQPSAGRFFDDAGDDARTHAAVVSWRMARTVAGTAADAINRSISVNGQPFTIVGVAARGFQGLAAAQPIDLWLPLQAEPDISTPTIFPDGRVVRGFVNTPGVGFLSGVIRLRPDASRASVIARLDAAVLAASEPGRERPRAWVSERAWITTFGRDAVVAETRQMRWAVAITLVLASACLGGLFAGRAAGRAREFAIRAALGSARAWLARLVVLEVTMVLTAAAVVAAPAAAWLLTWISDLHVSSTVRIADAVATSTTLAWLGRLVLLAAIMGLVASGGALAAALRTPATLQAGVRMTSGTRTFRRGLLALQIGAGCALISTALLLTASIRTLEGQSLGFDVGTGFATTDPVGSGLSPSEMASLVDRLYAVSSPPEASVAFVDNRPFTYANTLFLAGADSNTKRYPFQVSRVTPGYTALLGLRRLAGRDFTAGDRGRHVAILSAPLAETYWPHGDALGKRILIGGADGVPYDVIGIVAGARDLVLGTRPMAIGRLYLPYTEEIAESLTAVARSSAVDPSSAGRAAADALRRLDSRLVVSRQGVLRDLAWQSLEQRRLLRFVTTAVGFGSLAMIAVGVWGLSNAVLRQRWREFGIRQALGAGRGTIMRHAMRDAVVASLVGGALGVLGAWQFSILLKAMLVGVSPGDPLRLAASAALVIGAALTGAAPTARQAGRTDPALLLRAE